jgi:hypothetical protein
MILDALRTKFKKVQKYIETTIRQMPDLIALRSLIYDVIESQTVDESVKVLKQLNYTFSIGISEL